MIPDKLLINQSINSNLNKLSIKVEPSFLDEWRGLLENGILVGVFESFHDLDDNGLNHELPVGLEFFQRFGLKLVFWFKAEYV